MACGSSSKEVPETVGDSVPTVTPIDARPAMPDAAPAAAPVTVRDVLIAGSLTADEGRQVIEHNLPRWQECYEKALVADPELCGWASFEIEHARHGGFSSQVDSAEALDPADLMCMIFDLGAPSASLAAPGTTFRFMLVFTPPSKSPDECAPALLDRPDRSCATDDDCVAAMSYRFEDEHCCVLCPDTPANADWASKALDACRAKDHPDCPRKRCYPAPEVACKSGRCVATTK
jgi:hypothetical protein